MEDLSEEERELAKKEEAEIERRRDEASRAAAERGLADAQRETSRDLMVQSPIVRRCCQVVIPMLVHAICSLAARACMTRPWIRGGIIQYIRRSVQYRRRVQ